MRICMIFRDYEYCKMLAEMICSQGKDMIVEIVGSSNWNEDFDVALTDIDTDYSAIKSSAVICLTDNPEDDIDDNYLGGYTKLFKYKNISSLLSDIEFVHYVTSGCRKTYGVNSNIVAVCSDFFDKKIHLSQLLAKQFLFRKGGEVVIMPLNYFNNYCCVDEKDTSKFSRLMYYMDVGKDYSIDYFVFRDSFGVDYLRLPPGVNPLSYINEKSLEELIYELCHRKYETLILDIGNCFSNRNIELINRADRIVYFYEDENNLNIQMHLNEKQNEGKLEVIQINNVVDIDLIIDNYVRRTFCEKGSDSSEDKEINC